MKYASSVEQIEAIKTGTFLDRLSGIGGIPRGRITEIWGQWSSGKSSVCLQAVAEAQRQGLRCLWADVEYSYEARYAAELGVDNTSLGFIQEPLAEDVLDAIQQAVESGEWDLVILDSIGGLLSRQESEKGSGEKTIGGQAGIVAKFCRKIVPVLSLRNCALVVINHGYTDIMTGVNKPSGGTKLEFHKSLSIMLRPNTKKLLMQGEKKVGKVIIAEVKKNKIAGTERMTLEANLLFGEGFSKSADLLQDALDAGVIQKIDSYYYFEGHKIAYGLPKLRSWVKDNAEKLTA